MRLPATSVELSVETYGMVRKRIEVRPDIADPITRLHKGSEIIFDETFSDTDYPPLWVAGGFRARVHFNCSVNPRLGPPPAPKRNLFS